MAMAMTMIGMVETSSTLLQQVETNTPQQPNPRVIVGNRTYIGRYTVISQEYLGIEYAMQPTGERRFYPPLPLPDDQPPSTTDHSQRFGPVCLQGSLLLATNPDGTPQLQGEACLVLNVFVPLLHSSNSTHPLPVLVFGHGGGDGAGASSMGMPLLFNGSNAVAAVR
jgi:carboxylesterase type B